MKLLDWWYGITLLEEVTTKPHHRATRTYAGPGKQTLGGHKQNFCAPEPRRKEQRPHKRLTQTCPWVSRSLWQSPGPAVACYRAGGTDCSSACMGPFEGGHHYLHYLHHSLASGQITGREQSPTHKEKIGLKMYWAWLRPLEQDPVSPTVSLSYPSPSEGRQTENHSYRKLTNLITWTTALSNSMKLWTMPFWDTQDGWVMVESSGKTWSLEKEMANYFIIAALRTPWIAWKGKKIGQWMMNSTGW